MLKDGNVRLKRRDHSDVFRSVVRVKSRRITVAIRLPNFGVRILTERVGRTEILVRTVYIVFNVRRLNSDAHM